MFDLRLLWFFVLEWPHLEAIHSGKVPPFEKAATCAEGSRSEAIVYEPRTFNR